MADVTTLDKTYWPLMDAESVVLPCCAVCGRTWPLNQHHIVWRSWGQLYRDGEKVEKPVVTLCGEGNNLYGAAPDGTRVMWCHGKAHHRMLHFRNDRGRLEFIELDEPCDYDTALTKDGWEDICADYWLSRFACC